MHTWHHAKHCLEKYLYGVNCGISLSVWDFLLDGILTDLERLSWALQLRKIPLIAL